MRRRDFLAAAAVQTTPAPALPANVLVHEHVLVDFIGADQVSRDRYSLDEAFRAALPKVEALKPFGCRRIQECTPNFLGRDPRLLRRLQDATGIELWTNTGLYGAVNHKFLPKYVWQESARDLSRRWIAEVRDGVDGMKPSFLKTAVNEAPLNEIDRKLVEAAAITSLETGVRICSHTSGRGPAALAQLEILASLKCPASHFVWVHAQNDRHHEAHEQVARAGAWVEFDGINPKSAEWHKQCVLHMHERKLANRVLISQDSGWYRVGEPGGGTFNGFTFIYTGFLPGLPGGLAEQVMVKNPVAAFGA